MIKKINIWSVCLNVSLERIKFVSELFERVLYNFLSFGQSCGSWMEPCCLTGHQFVSRPFLCWVCLCVFSHYFHTLIFTTDSWSAPVTDQVDPVLWDRLQFPSCHNGINWSLIKWVEERTPTRSSGYVHQVAAFPLFCFFFFWFKPDRASWCRKHLELFLIKSQLSH